MCLVWSQYNALKVIFPVKLIPLNIPLMPLDMGYFVRDRHEEPADIDFRDFVSVQDVGRPYLKFPKILYSVH